MVYIWKDIKGYEGLYQVSDSGKVKSLTRKNIRRDGVVRILKGKKINPKLSKHGYLFVTLSKNGKLKNMSIHRLVAVAFIDNSHNKMEVNHKDGNKLNNSVDNLEWMTRKENMLHAKKNKLINYKGDSSPNRKLTVENSKQIRKLYEKGKFTQSEIGKMFNVHQSVISNVINNKSWI